MVCPPPLSKTLAMPRGVFRGRAIVPWSDFSPKTRWRPKKKVFTQIWSDFSSKAKFKFGHKVWSHKGYVLSVSSWLWVKNRTKFEWRPFFFCSLPDFGQKIGLGGTIWFRPLLFSHFLNFLAPPPLFKILRTLLAMSMFETLLTFTFYWRHYWLLSPGYQNVKTKIALFWY